MVIETKQNKASLFNLWVTKSIFINYESARFRGHISFLRQPQNSIHRPGDETSTIQNSNLYLPSNGWEPLSCATENTNIQTFILSRRLIWVSWLTNLPSFWSIALIQSNRFSVNDASFDQIVALVICIVSWLFEHMHDPLMRPGPLPLGIRAVTTRITYVDD